MKASDVRAVLTKHYALPDWCLLFEVANTVGTGSKRYADALAMCLVPSRGLALHGFEIKVSRQDLKAELAEIAKADAIGRYCDYWWVVTPKGLCSADELPLSWGLFEVDDDRLRERKAAQLLKPKCYDRAFVTALARRIGQLDAGIVGELVQAELRPARRRIEEFENALEDEVARRVRAQMALYEKLKADVTAFEKISGLRISNHWQVAETGPIAALVHKAGLLGTRGMVAILKNDLHSMAQRLQQLENQIQGIIQSERKAG